MTLEVEKARFIFRLITKNIPKLSKLETSFTNDITIDVRFLYRKPIEANLQGEFNEHSVGLRFKVLAIRIISAAWKRFMTGNCGIDEVYFK